MPLPRSASHEVARLLQAVAQPLYLLDEDRRIVFVNEACAHWLGVAGADLLGRVTHYQSSTENPEDAAQAVVNSLCPSPEAFQGRRTIGILSTPVGKQPHQQRRAEFLPLSTNDGETFCVLAVVDAVAWSGDTTVSNTTSTIPADEAQQLHHLVQSFRREMIQAHRLERLIGSSPAMARVRAQVKMAATTSGSVLIIGPSGIGRQHGARTIHALQPQNGGAFIPVQCAQLPIESLRSTLVSLLARHTRAEIGPPVTLLLADVDSLPAEMQAELVQFLSGPVQKLRIISTAQQILTPLSVAGTFRADLAHRLSTLVIELPALSQRREDIPLIAQTLLEELNGQGEKQLRGFTSEAIDRLTQHDWSGQIDELAGVVREAFAQAEGIEITPIDLPKRLRQAAEAARLVRQPPEPIDLEKFLAQAETELIQRALQKAKGNKTQAARLLGLNRPRLYRRMVQLGLETAADDADEG